MTKERIDRAMANKKVLDLLPGLCCNVLLAIKSDHFPLLITISSLDEERVKRPYIFKFEVAWDLREDCPKLSVMHVV